MVFSNFDLAKTSQHGWKEHLKVKQVAKFMNADVLCWKLDRFYQQGLNYVCDPA